MDFALTESQELIKKEVGALARTFSLDYWLDKDDRAEYPSDFVKAFADNGWLGIMLPSKAVLSRCGARIGWPPGPAWIALAGAALIGVQLAARTFATNDEARFPLLAQDILARGDWLRPRLNGVGYFNKPPLLAWLIALVSWPFGRVTEWTTNR